MYVRFPLIISARGKWGWISTYLSLSILFFHLHLHFDGIVHRHFPKLPERLACAATEFSFSILLDHVPNPSPLLLLLWINLILKMIFLHMSHFLPLGKSLLGFNHDSRIQ
jgi:hypothetical protein